MTWCTVDGSSGGGPWGSKVGAWDAGGELLAEQRVEANFALNAAKAGRWVAGGFGAV
jgi:hypothetical protein